MNVLKQVSQLTKNNNWLNFYLYTHEKNIKNKAISQVKCFLTISNSSNYLNYENLLRKNIIFYNSIYYKLQMVNNNNYIPNYMNSKEQIILNTVKEINYKSFLDSCCFLILNLINFLIIIVR